MSRLVVVLALLLAGCTVAPMPSDETALAPLFPVVSLEYAGSEALSVKISGGTLMGRDGLVRPAYEIGIAGAGDGNMTTAFAIDAAGHLVRSTRHCVPSVTGGCQGDFVQWNTYGAPPPIGIGWPSLWHSPDAWQQPYVASWIVEEKPGITVLRAEQPAGYAVPWSHQRALATGVFEYEEDPWPVRFEQAGKKFELISVSMASASPPIPIWPAPPIPEKRGLRFQELIEPFGELNYSVSAALHAIEQHAGTSVTACRIVVASADESAGPLGLLPSRSVSGEVLVTQSGSGRAYKVGKSEGASYSVSETSADESCRGDGEPRFTLTPNGALNWFDRARLQHLTRYIGLQLDAPMTDKDNVFNHPAGGLWPGLTVYIMPPPEHVFGSVGSQTYTPNFIRLSATDGLLLVMVVDQRDMARLDATGM